MIRTRCIHSGSPPLHRERVTQVVEIFNQAFPGLCETAENLSAILERPVEQGYRASLVLLETGLGQVNAFALLLEFPNYRGAFLDYIAVRQGIRGGGFGTALYEAVREYCRDAGAKSLLLEVQPDDAASTRDPAELEQARKRLRFYERYGVRPVLNTKYSEPVGEPPTTAYLLYDGLGRSEPLRRDELRNAVRIILRRRFFHVASEEYTRDVVASIVDDPVVLRPPQYDREAERPHAVVSRHLERTFRLISSTKHTIHHVRQRGYFERPARVGALLESLRKTGLFSEIPPRSFSREAILAVHDKHFVRYLREICLKIAGDRPVYPDTFPVRRPDRRPKILPTQAGYYCIDSCTPLDGNAYRAARAAVDVALTGATEILSGTPVAYALCRPPGHHAERRVYGGFCYFNNAAISAHYLSAHGRVAVLDIDYHHGNGTQDIFYDRSDILTVSIHGHPDHAFPYFSGFAAETGEGHGVGFNLNLPLPPGTEEAAYLRALDKALRAIRSFGPDMLVVSLGLDVLRGDPTGTFSLKPSSMAEIARRIGALRLPLLVVQEGGYNLRSIKRGVADFFGALADTVR